MSGSSDPLGQPTDHGDEMLLRENRLFSSGNVSFGKGSHSGGFLREPIRNESVPSGMSSIEGKGSSSTWDRGPSGNQSRGLLANALPRALTFERRNLSGFPRERDW